MSLSLRVGTRSDSLSGSTYSDADRKYYQTHKQQCLDNSRPHKKAYWIANKEELKAKRREYYLRVEKPLRLAKRLIHEPI